MANVLDIDLDLFLNGRKTWGDPAERPSNSDFSPWSENKLRRYLENNCGLTKTKPIPGATFMEHHELFWHLKNEYQNKILTEPIELYHLDAHADLGLGGSSYVYVLTELLHKSPDERTEPKEDGQSGLNLGSWLLFAIACRWIKRIIYVHHPNIQASNIDIGTSILKNHNLSSKMIQLKVLPHSADLGSRRIEYYHALAYEPSVPITYVSRDKFNATESFDRIYLTHSPGYVPPSCDKLLDVIREYIQDF